MTNDEILQRMANHLRISTEDVLGFFRFMNLKAHAKKPPLTSKQLDAISAMKACKGNQALAAKQLDITAPSLRERLLGARKKLGHDYEGCPNMPYVWDKR